MQENNIQNNIEDPFNNNNNQISNNNQTYYDINKAFIENDPKPHTEHGVVFIQNQNVNVEFSVPGAPKVDYMKPMWDKLNLFEAESWSDDDIGLKTGFTTIDDAFDGGLKNGFIVLAGDSNLGKSAIMSQLAWQIASLNDNAYVMDFSLDDPMNDHLARIIASGSKVFINAAKNPKNYTKYPGMLVRRRKALNILRSKVSNYCAYDASETSFIEDIEDMVKQKAIDLKAAGVNKKIVVFIDNLHDLNIKSQPNLEDKSKFERVAEWASDLAIRYKIPVVCTAELKKLNSTRRPTLDDIRECVKIKYEAKAIILVYNEVHYKGEGAQIYYAVNNNPLKQPVLELHFAKNKISSYKGRCFFNLFPSMARIEEVPKQTAQTYANLIYGA